MEYVELAGGVRMPAVGFGTWKAAGAQIDDAMARDALEAGYRHFDSAEYYGTEEAIGRAIRESGLPREEVTVTSKVWKTHMGYRSTLEAFENSLRRFGFEYLDLYFSHWPKYDIDAADWEEVLVDTWRAMEEIKRSGRVRALAVSNFKPSHLEALLRHGFELPVLNQVEFHPGWLQEETRAWCDGHGVAVQAWRPLAQGQVLQHPAIADAAEAHGVEPGQVALRFDWQCGVSVIPKSSSPERMRSNIDIFGFRLSEDEMEAIRAIPRGTGWSGIDPDGEWPSDIKELKID